MNLKRRLPQYLVGLLLMALGIVLVKKAEIGISPVSAIPAALSNLTPFTLGNTTIAFHVLCVLVQILLMRQVTLKTLLILPLAVCVRLPHRPVYAVAALYRNANLTGGCALLCRDHLHRIGTGCDRRRGPDVARTGRIGSYGQRKIPQAVIHSEDFWRRHMGRHHRHHRAACNRNHHFCRDRNTSFHAAHREICRNFQAPASVPGDGTDWDASRTLTRVAKISGDMKTFLFTFGDFSYIICFASAPVAQLDRATASDAVCRWFESSRGCQIDGGSVANMAGTFYFHCLFATGSLLY